MYNCMCNYMYVGVTGELLYWIMWEAVHRLEECGLKVCHLFVCLSKVEVSIHALHACNFHMFTLPGNYCICI